MTDSQREITYASAGEKPLPYNAEAEEAVIGCVLIDRDVLKKIAPILRSTDFFSEEWASVYEASLALYQQRGPSEMFSLRDELNRRRKLGEGEGQVKASHLFKLLQFAPNLLQVENYAQTVLRYAVMRRIIGLAAEMRALVFNEQLDTQEMIDQIQKLSHNIMPEDVKHEAVRLGVILEEFFEELILRQEKGGGFIGVPSGYHDLDTITGGFYPSHLIILAARPSTGKTSLALGIAYNVAMNKQRPRPVGIFSLEMSKESLAQRLVAMETGIDSTRIGTGYIDEQERDRVSHAFGKLSTAPIYIDDSVGVGIMELQSRALRMKAEYGIELLVIDYLQLMMGFTNGNYTREEEVSEISSSLKVLAGKLNLPIICLSQMSSAEKKSSSPIPQLSDLWKQDCNSLEGDADLVLFIYREEMFNPKTEKKNIAEIHIAKHRHGLTGVVQLSFDNQTTRFDNLIPYLG